VTGRFATIQSGVVTVRESITGNRFMVTKVCRTTKALGCSISMQSQRHCSVASCKALELAYRSRRLPAVRQGLLGSREVEVVYCTCFLSKCCSGTSTRAHGHSHKGIEQGMRTRFGTVNPHKCESEILSKSGSTPVRGPVKSGRKQMKEKGRG